MDSLIIGKNEIIIIIVMKKREREKNKHQENRVMYNVITNRPLTDVQTVPYLGIDGSQPIFPSLYYECDVLGYGMSIPILAQFGSAVLSVLPPDCCAPAPCQIMEN